MKSLLKIVFACIGMVVLAGLLSAQTTTPLVAGGAKTFPVFNPPPCDFSDQFYADNGMDSARIPTRAELNTEPDGRFGDFRQFGPPATGSQANWVTDSNCATNDPTHRNFRILANTGAFKDGAGTPTEFLTINAFIHNQNAFTGAPGAVTHSVSRVVGAIGPNGGLDNQQTNPGETISIQPGTDAAGNTTGLNPRGISMQFIVSNFEAYAALKQTLTSGQFAGTIAPSPCGHMFDPLGAGINQNDCFSVQDGKNPDGSTLSDVATPNLRQDWRVGSDRNAMDGLPASDNNCINVSGTPPLCSPTGAAGPFSDSPFGYFCDDELGMWIVTYWWYTQNGVGGFNNATPPQAFAIDPICKRVMSCFSSVNGNSLDGTPIVKSGSQLHFLEGRSSDPTVLTGSCLQQAQTQLNFTTVPNPCAQEGNLPTNGADGGAVWLVCPVMPDPRNGGIAKDAFLDVVRFSNGNAMDSGLLNNFSCLQQTGKFCNETAPGQ